MVQALQLPNDKQYPTGTVVVERAPRELFYSPEQPPASLYVLLKGRVSVARLTREGNRLVTEILEPGSVLGDLSLCGLSNDNEVAQALTHCRALAVDSRHVQSLVESDPALASRLLAAMASRLSAAHDRLEQFAYSPVEARLASAILQLTGSDASTAPVSHQLLAEIAGTYRETASRVLGKLQAENVLRLRRCAIEVRDPGALAVMAAG